MADLVLAVIRGLRPVELSLFVVSCVLQARLVAPKPGKAARRKPRAKRSGEDRQSGDAAPSPEAVASPEVDKQARSDLAAPGADQQPEEPVSAPAPSLPPLLALAAPLLGLTRSLVARAPFARTVATWLGDAVTHSALTPVCGALTAVHLLFEGARWQLCGLYSATAGAALSQALAPSSARLFAGAVCACCTAVTAFATWAFPWFVLPKPTGPYRVGRLTAVWTDPTRGAWVTPDKGSPRRLLVDIWYPATPGGGKVVRYMDAVLAEAMSTAFLGPRAWFVASHFSLVPTSSRRGAPAAMPPPHMPGGFPVVLFSHGNVSTRVQNTSLLDELSSDGYICVSPDHPHDAAVVAYPDGSLTEFEWDLPEPLDAPGVLAFRAAQVDLRAGDMAFCLQQVAHMGAHDTEGPLFGRVDAARACVLGHSFGGATAAVAARQLPLKAAVLLDAWQWPLGRGSSHLPDEEDNGSDAGSYCPSVPLPCPALLFESDAFLGDRDAFCAFNGRMSSAQALASPCCWKVVARVGHYEYADMSLTAPHFMRASGLLALRAEELHSFHSYQVQLVRSFLEAHLRGVQPSGDGHSGGHPNGVASTWSPPESRFASTCTRAALAADVAGQGYTPRQLAAMRLLYLQVRRGDYEIWSVRRDLEPSHELPAAIVPVIHTHGYASLRGVMTRIAEEEAAAEAQRQRRSRRQSSAASR